MPVHDWTRVDAGTFHDFHSAWITHLKERLNNGLLPRGYYAMAEQQAGRMIADILTLRVEEGSALKRGNGAPVGIVAAPSRVRRRIKAGPKATFRAMRRTLAIRHVSKHRIVALVEILSPGNKDRETSVAAFVNKAHRALEYGCNLLVIDLFPPGPFDPQGIQAAIWADLDPDEEVAPVPGKPITLGAYSADKIPEAELECVGIGDPLPEMPLILDDGCVNTPLEETYASAYRGLPEYWREILERKT